MLLSLRTKLFSLVIASLALAVIPLLILTYNNLRQSGRELERESFGNMVVLVEDGISSRYLNLLSTEVMDVLQRKNELRRTATLARTTWLGASALHDGTLRERIMSDWTDPLMSFSTHLEIFSPEGEPLLGAPLLSSLAYDAGLFDFKGRPLQPMLDVGNLPPEGSFSVFNISLEKAVSTSRGTESLPEGPAPVLVYFLPVPETRNVISVALLLSDITQAASYSEQEIVRSTQEKFNTLNLYRNGFISLFDGSGKLLAHKGNELGRDVSLIPHAALNEARDKGFVEFVATKSGKEEDASFDSTIFRIAHFKALNWYVVAAAPSEEIEAPTNALMQRLVAVSLAIVVLSLLCTLVLTARLINPLRALTRKALALPNIDFASPDAEERTRKGLPLTQSDELGQLARAFARMGESLARNIRKLMDTTASKQRMEGELNAARDIQMGILPAADTAPALPEYASSAFLEPAKEVGGDLYDFFVAPDGRQAVVIGDVSGKGVPAALFMSMTVTLVRYALSGGLSPAEAMTRINDVMSANNPGCMFVTLFIGLLDVRTGELEYANGGHCPPLVVNASCGDVRTLAGMSGPLVGAMDGMVYESCHAVLEHGDLCLLYTDGVTEAMNEKQELFADDRLAGIMEELRAASPDALIRAVYDALLTFRGAAEPSDDITMLSFVRR